MQFQPYPFERLGMLFANIVPPGDKSTIALTIGEPQFSTPQFVQEALCEASFELNKYPKTAGEEYLKQAQLSFFKKRFGISLKESEIIPTFGTREVLFNFPQFALSEHEAPLMAYVNPFYQIYEGAAIASKAKVLHLDLLPENDFLPLFDEESLKKCDLIILNSPSNPTGKVMSLEALKPWAKLAYEHDVIVLNDECYSEIYTTTPPPSLLEAAHAIGNLTCKNTLVVNSISKRSSAPGLRSGFIAGDSAILKEYARYRTYVGCAVPLPLQRAAAKAWNDELHVSQTRELYFRNMELASEILGVEPSSATFYIWLHVGDGEAFAKSLYKAHGIAVLPGIYLGRNGMGSAYVRIALVHAPSVIEEALVRVADHYKGWA